MKDYSDRNLTRQYQLRDKKKFVEKELTTKEKNDKAREITKEYEIEKELENTIDLYKDAKKSGNHDLALEILDQRIKLEAKRETEQFFRTQVSPEELTLKTLKKWKEEGEI